MRKLNGLRLTWALLFYIAAALGSSAQTFTSLVAFDGTNGRDPIGPLVQGIDGNLYGVTGLGGPYCISQEGCGTIFKITPAGKLTTIYNFCPQDSYPDCADGYEPGSLIVGTNGNFYGTTFNSGANGQGGTVFEITPSGHLTTLYSFCSEDNCADGNRPNGLLLADDGNFYGTTFEGGTSGYGTVFKITQAGKLTTLYSFFCSQPPCADGQFPTAGVVQGLNGSFYGTTPYGGVYCRGGCGTVFEITAVGKLTTLYNFCGHTDCSDGSTPYAGLTLATNGNLYGTTAYGGYNSEGTIFAITPAGKLVTIYRFCEQGGNCSDGSAPDGLVQATNGDFFGPADGGDGGDGVDCNPGDCGILFQMTPTGTLTKLYDFCSQPGCADGEDANDLVQATDGNFYGTTEVGGDPDCNTTFPYTCGTVFSLSIGLGPFAETLPTAAKVGAEVGILGNDLTGTTSVTFNGTLATFTVKSATLIEATIPAGATTGYVTVFTPTGVLTSNVPFHVIP